jgi:hypothetical protein
MFFIIAQSLAPLGDYLNRNFGNIFKINKYKLSPIVPVDDLESYNTTPLEYSYSTQEELDKLV